jgi:hypothetical protein
MVGGVAGVLVTRSAAVPAMTHCSAAAAAAVPAALGVSALPAAAAAAAG